MPAHVNGQMRVSMVVTRDQIITQTMRRHILTSVKSANGLFTVVEEGSVWVRVLSVDVFVRKKAQNIVGDDIDAFFIPAKNEGLRKAAARIGIREHEAVDAYQYSHRVGQGLMVNSFYNDFTVLPMRAHAQLFPNLV